MFPDAPTHVVPKSGSWRSPDSVCFATAHFDTSFMLYTMYNDVYFEWAAEKNRANQTKHAGIDFETAPRVFADPDLMLRKDRVIDGGQRWHGIGACLLYTSPSP